MNRTQIEYLKDLLRFSYREAREIMLIEEEDRSDSQDRLAKIVDNLAHANVSSDELDSFCQEVEVYTEVGHLGSFSKQEIFKNLLFIHQHSSVELDNQKYTINRIQLGKDDSIELEVASEQTPMYSIHNPRVSVINNDMKNTEHKQFFVELESMAEGFLPYAEEAELPIMLGKDELGEPRYFNLAALPHLLVGGKTESGKTVFLDNVVASIKMVRSPEEVQFIMIDPKMIELGVYNGSPYLLRPVITNMEDVLSVWESLMQDIDQKYELLQKESVRNIVEYNHKQKARNNRTMGSTVVIVNQLESIVKHLFHDVLISILKKARTVGVHFILITSSPRADVLTGTMKAAIPGRICFAVHSQLEYQTLMGTTAGDYPKLLGKGDGMAILNNEVPFRFQSMIISDPSQTMQNINGTKENPTLKTDKEIH